MNYDMQNNDQKLAYVICERFLRRRFISICFALGRHPAGMEQFRPEFLADCLDSIVAW